MNKNKNIEESEKRYREKYDWWTKTKKQIINDYQKEYVKKHDPWTKNKNIKDYRREYYKKCYVAKKLNNNEIIDDSDKIIDDSDNDNKIYWW